MHASSAKDARLAALREEIGAIERYGFARPMRPALPFGIADVDSRLAGCKWTCASITAKVTGDRVIRNQEGEFVEATFIKFLR